MLIYCLMIKENKKNKCLYHLFKILMILIYFIYIDYQNYYLSSIFKIRYYYIINFQP